MNMGQEPVLNIIVKTRSLLFSKMLQPMDIMIDKSTAAGCINSATFWLEGLYDGSAVTKAECMELLAMAIDDLQAAYRMMAKEV